MSETKSKTSTEHQPALSPDMIGFRLLKLTNLLSRPFFGKFATQHELSLNEWRTMVVLASRPGSAAQDVAMATGVHPMNISRALAGLRKAGRVEEARDPNNHRRTLLWLTRSGEKLYREIAPHSEKQAERMLAPLTSTEIAALARIVDKLIAQAEEIVGAEVE